MKKMLVCFFLFSLSFSIFPVFAQESGDQSEVIVTSVIEKVTVYSDRAVVERSAAFEMKAGTYSFVFDDLPEQVNAESLQLKGQGDAVQEDLVFRTKFYTDIPDDRIEALQAQRDEADSKVQTIADSLSRLSSEIEYLIWSRGTLACTALRDHTATVRNLLWRR